MARNRALFRALPCALLLAALLLLPALLLPRAAAGAFEPTEIVTQTYSEEFILSRIPDFVATPEGGTDWQLLGETREIPYTEKDKQGFERTGVTPEFPDALKKLDGKTVILRGFMFPLDQSERQKVFLLGPFPLTCPYHYHVSNNLIVETHMKQPLAFSYDPVTIEGRLELVPRDDDYNTFYRLHDAVPKK